MSRIPAALWHKLIAIQVYGANTGVGKTVFSTLLVNNLLRGDFGRKWNINYVKPVSTGPKDEADQK
jgi:dethiobiotin synthetase/adenosylmethionine--8-amino-7-oxononanoate aminotransferase